MKSLLREMKEKFQEIENDYCDGCDRPSNKCVCDDEIEEQNVTGAIAGFNTPKAFAKKTNDKTAEQLGYKKVEEAMEKKYLAIIEGYRDFKKGDVKPSHTVKNTIKEIAKKLQEIETLVQYNSRLKTESGIASSEYGPATSKALTKISERLVKISERVRSLGE
jgi:hypothetical protein